MVDIPGIGIVGLQRSGHRGVRGVKRRGITTHSHRGDKTTKKAAETIQEGEEQHMKVYVDGGLQRQPLEL